MDGPWSELAGSPELSCEAAHTESAMLGPGRGQGRGHQSVPRVCAVAGSGGSSTETSLAACYHTATTAYFRSRVRALEVVANEHLTALG